MAEDNRPSDALLAVFASIRTIRGLEPFPSWPYKQALSKAELIEKPSLAWNAFISIVGEASYEELSPVQQVAHLGYWYEAEVYNGGHLQYFRNDTRHYGVFGSCFPLARFRSAGISLPWQDATCRFGCCPRSTLSRALGQA